MEKKFAQLREHNFDSCQLVSWNPAAWTDENASLLKNTFGTISDHRFRILVRLERTCGMELYDGPLTLGLVPVEYRQMRIENLCDGADFAHKLGITDVVTHMGFIPENPYDPNFSSFCIAVRTVAEHLKKNGQCLLFETGQETPVTMLRCFEAVGTDNLYVNLTLQI